MVPHRVGRSIHPVKKLRIVTRDDRLLKPLAELQDLLGWFSVLPCDGRTKVVCHVPRRDDQYAPFSQIVQSLAYLTMMAGVTVWLDGKLKHGYVGIGHCQQQRHPGTVVQPALCIECRQGKYWCQTICRLGR